MRRALYHLHALDVAGVTRWVDAVQARRACDEIADIGVEACAIMKRRKLNLKANVQSSSTYSSFKR